MILPLILWICLIVLVLPIYLVIVLPLGIWRVLVDLFAKLRRDLVETLDSRDLVFTGDDYYGRPRKCVISCVILDGNVTLATLKEKFRKNVLDKESFFKLHCRPTRFLGYWFWQRTEIQEDKQYQQEEKRMTQEELNLLLPEMVSQGYAEDTPLWEFKLIPLKGDRTALIMKLHHLVADGVSFMFLLEEFCDSGWTNLQVPETKPFTLLHWIYAWYSFPWKALKAYWLARRRKSLRPKNPTGDGFTSYTAFPMEKLKVVRRANKCLFPSVLAGMISNAMHKQYQLHGKSDAPDIVRMVIPTPYPNRPKGALVNHVGWIHAEMPIGDPAIIKQFESSVRQSYISGLHGIMWNVFRGLYVLPAPFLAVYTGWGERNLPPVVLTSIPGSLTPVSLLGQDVICSYPTLALGCSTGEVTMIRRGDYPIAFKGYLPLPKTILLIRCSACMTTYADAGYFSIRVSKDIISSQEQLDQLVHKLMHDELESMYQDAINKETKKLNPYVQIDLSCSSN